MNAPVNGTPAPVPVRPRRRITGMAAVLLPLTPDGGVDHPGFEAHLERTLAAGLTPAVNMDTGFGPVLEPTARAEVLARTRAVCEGHPFVAGVHVDHSGPLDLDAYRRGLAEVAAAGGLPITFPSAGLAALDDDGYVEAHRAFAAEVDALLAFELGPEFHPAGRIPSIAVFTEVMGIPQVRGCKHSSLRRDLEWERLAVRDARRPDFLLLTGNDRAVDMVIYGSDYLLGLATFAPDAFAARDGAWAGGDLVRFWALNDLLAYLGQFAFRAPVPAYRHDAAMFLTLRGQLGCDRTHPSSPSRPDSDREVLAEILARLEAALTG